jgi:nucleotide-binding universal stress UspA family protein
MFKRIVVGSDGSPNGDRALQVARDLAVASSAHLFVIHINQVVAGKGGAYPVLADEPEMRARLKAQVQQFAAAGIDAEFHVHNVGFESPAHTIGEDARARDADLIVVGSRGRAPFTQFVLGSVPMRLLHIAHCPVLVVPPPAEDGVPEVASDRNPGEAR